MKPLKPIENEELRKPIQTIGTEHIKTHENQ